MLLPPILAFHSATSITSLTATHSIYVLIIFLPLDVSATGWGLSVLSSFKRSLWFPAALDHRGVGASQRSPCPRGLLPSLPPSLCHSHPIYSPPSPGGLCKIKTQSIPPSLQPSMAPYGVGCPSMASRAPVRCRLLTPFSAPASQSAPHTSPLPSLTYTQCHGSCLCPTLPPEGSAPRAAWVGPPYTPTRGILGLRVPLP